VTIIERKDARHFSQELLDLFDRYVHGLIDRATFLEQAAKFATGGVTAAGLLEALSPRFAEAQQVAPDDKRLVTESVEYESPLGSGKVRAYSARPADAKGKLPAVLVVHENRGLNPHIADVTRRLALEGFSTLAPDALSPVGGYPGDEDKAREAFAKLDQAKAREDFIAGVGYLKNSRGGTGRVGAVGFCYGGGIVSLLASRVPDLAAAVPFYGLQPKEEDVARIRAPLLIHYAEHDERINAGIPAFEQALHASRIDYQLYTYAGTQHGELARVVRRPQNAVSKSVRPGQAPRRPRVPTGIPTKGCAKVRDGCRRKVDPLPTGRGRGAGHVTPARCGGGRAGGPLRSRWWLSHHADGSARAHGLRAHGREHVRVRNGESGYL